MGNEPVSLLLGFAVAFAAIALWGWFLLRDRLRQWWRARTR